MKFTAINLHRIWSDLDCKIESYHKRVREGVDVLPASELGRLIEGCGIVELLEMNASDGVFKIDGRGLRKKIRALLSDCGEWFSLHEHSNIERALQIPRTQMEKVNARLERMERLLEKIPPQITEHSLSIADGPADVAGTGTAPAARPGPCPCPHSGAPQARSGEAAPDLDLI